MAIMALKKLLQVALFIIIFSFTHEARSAPCGAGNLYSISTPTSLVVTMGDSSAIIPVTVTNTSTSLNSIAYVRIDFIAFIYYVSYATVPPAGWTIDEIKNAGAGGGQTYIAFRTTTNAIAPEGSRTFNIFVTGDNNQDLPPRIAGSIKETGVDQTDSIVDDANSTVMTVDDANASCFTRDGGTATWKRHALYGVMSASPPAVGSNGSVTLTFTVTNRSAFAQATVLPDTPTVNPAGAADCPAADWSPPTASNLQPGESATFQKSCTINGSGGVRFCGTAGNGDGSATSALACSKEVAAGNFTALLSIYPSNVTPGQNVTVTMTVENHGSSALHSITPVLSNVPSVATFVSGPTPGSIGNLAGGASTPVTWVYTINGTIGTTFTFSGGATSSEEPSSNPASAVSNTGTIVPYSVEVTPNTAYYLDTNVTFTFRVRNAGGYPVFKVWIETPDPGFLYAAASSSCMTSGEITSAPPIVKYLTADTCSCGAPARCTPCTNGVCDFSITYSQLPDVSQNVNSSTDFNFRVDLWDTPLNKQNDDPRSSMGVIVRITKNKITVDAVPLTIRPGCSSTIIATVTPAPDDGSFVGFTTTGGTLYSITTTTGGAAYASLKKEPSDPTTAAWITGTYQDVSASRMVTFSGLPCTSNLRRFRWQEIIQ